MSKRRIGLLGGTFDPIHMGHLDLAATAESTLALTELVVIPANVPPHRPKPLTSPFHRFAMVALTVAGRPGWRASDMELRHEAPSYTVITLRRFHDRGYEPGDLFFLIGADAFTDITSWRDYPAILDKANFVVISRPRYAASQLRERLSHLSPRMVDGSPGMTLPPTPAIILIDAATSDVSSTDIRSRLGRGESIEGLVGPPVQQHILQHGLYRGSWTVRRVDAGT